MSFDLTKYIKYCLGYVKLTSQNIIFLQKKYSVELSSQYFNLLGLLNIDLDGNPGETVNLNTFYSYDTKAIPKESKSVFEAEKIIATKLEDIYNKQRNDPYTKQTIFNFGYFKLEIPRMIEGELGLDEENVIEQSNSKTEEVEVTECPLFTLPIRIEKETTSGVGKYCIYLVDPEFHINIRFLEPVLGSDLYYQLVEKFGIKEVEGRFILPVTNLDVFNEIWQEIKAQLRLSKAIFDESSFSLEKMDVSLTPKVNYFLAEDLEKLSKLEDRQLSGTALKSWVDNTDLNIHETINESEIYFPFLYDKYQLRTLTVANNKASVIQGPPGTGKSETIANLVCHLAAKGKKVLFVSQKAQALKVVKDKLKKLKVAYLYGYLPNPNSRQLDEEDEEDGIAVQLASLDGYIEKLLYKSNPGVESNNRLQTIYGEREGSRKLFNSAIDSERQFSKNLEEYISLKEFSLGELELKKFIVNFNQECLKSIQTLRNEITTLKKRTNEYEQSQDKVVFDNLFGAIKIPRGALHYNLRIIKDDYQKTGYDRHSKLFRNLNNGLRNIRLGKTWGNLPREISDVISSELSKDISKCEGVEFLGKLYRYFEDYNDNELITTRENDIVGLLDSVGLRIKQVDKFLNFLQKTLCFDDVKGRVVRSQTLFKILNNDVAGFLELNQIAVNLRKHEQSRTKTVALYLQNLVNQKFLSRWKNETKLRQIIKKLGKAFGKSKKAYKTFDNLRSDPENFKSVLNLIPIWIMELDDASRIIPLEACIFDYVLLDEASQCNIAYTLPAMYRARNAMFFGDSEQMRDSTVIFKSNQAFDELATRYQVPDDLKIKSTGNAVQSVLDIASFRGFLTIPLRYHYRSPKELIGFSNKYFYKPKGKELIPLNNNYLTYGDTNKVMVLHQVDVDNSLETSDKISVSETQAILQLFKNLKSDVRYRNKSIGILSFFNAQAAYLRNVFEKEGFKEEVENYKISIIEGIQGDEKDIIIYSFVLRNPDQVRQYYPLTGEGGDIRGDINKGRVNVAFSRARQQVHCFLSMPLEEIPDRIWIKKYLKYTNEHGEISALGVELKPFESGFEKAFYNYLKAKTSSLHIIQNQVSSCGFRIDFVITNIKTGGKLAIECDGPCHFKDELDEEFGMYIESDEERQRVLEAAGWEFYRVKYSDWFRKDEIKRRVAEEIITKIAG